MRVKLSALTAMLAAGAAATAIAAAPTAMAAAPPKPAPVVHACANGICSNTHSSLPAGELPGNSQIDASPGAVSYAPQYPYAEGDYFGGYYRGFGRGGLGGGGFSHGGGFGHGGGGGHGGK